MSRRCFAHTSARLLASILLVLTAGVATGPSPQAQSQAQQSERVRKGVRHFERGFYELTPDRRDVEASREFDLAIEAFEAEAAAAPTSATAHSYLGRIYNLKRDYKKAAAHYDRLSDIEPLNADACVLAALAYAEDGQIAEARARLAAAKRRTSDADALARLAEFVRRLDNQKR
jgi:tetratricopeptide (TPR) repeat protein